jgi:hypothetical protein
VKIRNVCLGDYNPIIHVLGVWWGGRQMGDMLSIAYHLRMGFEAEPSETQEDGLPYHLDYDGVGEHQVLFVKQL